MKIQNGRHFWGEENFLKIANNTLLIYPGGLGDRHIHVFFYVAVTQEVKTITINNTTKQVIAPINLHTKFYKDELNMFLLKE